MYSVYNSKIYNLFLKEERKKRNLKIEELSQHINYSLGFISQLENYPDLLNNDNSNILLSFYGYDNHYLKAFDDSLNKLMVPFINAILYIDDAQVKSSIKEIDIFLNRYKNQEIYHAYYLIHFIYNIYYFDLEKANYYLRYISTHEQYYSKKYQALIKLYLSRYYLQIMNYDQAILLLSSPIFNEVFDHNIEGFRFISLSTCYMRKKDIRNAIKYCDDAVGCFTSTNNYRRLLNTNITKANQLLKIKDYKGYITLNNQILEAAQKFNYSYEIATLLHNNAFVYMMQNDYEKALSYYRNIPINELREKHYCSYLICLVETDNDEEAITLSMEWKEKAANPYFKDLFKVFHDYLLNKDLMKLNRALIKIVKTHKDTIDMFEIEYLYVLIAYHYKKLNMYKSTMEYLEKLRELDFSD